MKCQILPMGFSGGRDDYCSRVPVCLPQLELCARGVIRATMAGFHQTLSGVPRPRAIKLRDPSRKGVEARASGMFFLIRQEMLRMEIPATSPVIIIIGGAR